MAEDDENVRAGFCTVLKNAGYRVLEAENGLEALELSRSQRAEIKLVVLDVVMPKLSGPEVFDTIREENISLPIIFCSGYSRHLLKEELLREKDVVLMDKPLSADLLLTKVRELLDASPA